MTIYDSAKAFTQCVIEFKRMMDESANLAGGLVTDYRAMRKLQNMPQEKIIIQNGHIPQT